MTWRRMKGSMTWRMPRRSVLSLGLPSLQPKLPDSPASDGRLHASVSRLWSGYCQLEGGDLALGSGGVLQGWPKGFCPLGPQSMTSGAVSLLS